MGPFRAFRATCENLQESKVIKKTSKVINTRMQTIQTDTVHVFFFLKSDQEFVLLEVCTTALGILGWLRVAHLWPPERMAHGSRVDGQLGVSLNFHDISGGL